MRRLLIEDTVFLQQSVVSVLWSALLHGNPTRKPPPRLRCFSFRAEERASLAATMLFRPRLHEVRLDLSDVVPVVARSAGVHWFVSFSFSLPRLSFRCHCVLLDLCGTTLLGNGRLKDWWWKVGRAER